jgi:peptidoglycan/LPS O-acetylase OafA/YrhL
MLFVPRRLLIPCTVALLVAAPAFRIAAAASFGSDPSSLSYIQTSPLAVCDSLAAGALLALLLHRGAMTRARARAASLAGIGVALASLAVAYYDGSRAAAFGFAETGYALALAALVYGAARGFGGPLGRVLGSRRLVHLGRISYGIYILHSPVAGALARAEERADLPLGTHGPAFFALASALTIGAAAVSWELLERPLNELKRFFPYERSTEPGPREVVRAAPQPAAAHRR